MRVIMERKKIQKKWIIIIAIFVVLAIILIGLGFYFSRKTSAKSIFLSSYDYLMSDSAYSSLEDWMEPLNTSFFKEDITMDMQLNSSLELGFSKFSISATAQKDSVSKRATVSFHTKIDENDLLTGDIYQDEKNTYFTINDIFDKYYSVTPGYTEQAIVTMDDLKYLVEIFGDNIELEIKEEDFTKEKTTTMIEGTEENCTKVSLKITPALFQKIFYESLTDIKNDDRALSILSVLTQLEKDELVDKIDDILNDNNELDEENLYYNIYYQGKGDIRKVELAGDTSIATFTRNNGKQDFIVISDNQEVIQLTMEEDPVKMTFEIFGEDNAAITGELQEKDGKYVGTLQMTDQDEEVLKMDITLEKKGANHIAATFDIQLQGVEFGTISLETKVESGEAIPEKDMTNSKAWDAVTEEEQQQIILNIINHEVLGPAFETFLLSFANGGTQFQF